MVHNGGAPASDEALVELARAGDTDSYAELWRRHSDAARRAAAQFRSVADPDDLVAEAYTRILVAIRKGKGPHGAFRPYLFVTVRNLVNLRSRAPRGADVEDLDELADPSAPSDPSIAALDRSLTVRAFRSLPENWQTVLWYSEVEGMRPQEIAPIIGLSANATSALAHRARDGLRTAWLQAHINADATPEECRRTLSHMAAYTRGTLSARDQRRADEHISGCPRCMIVASETDEIGSHLGFVLLPIALGGLAAAAYRAQVAANAASASPAPTPRPPVADAGRPPLSHGAAWAVGASVAVAVVVAASIAAALALPQEEQPTTVVAQETVPSEATASNSRPTDPKVPPVAPPAPVVSAPPLPVASPPVASPPVASPAAPSAPPPPLPPPPPLDASADAPVVLSVLGAADAVRPTLDGVAEPLATIVVTDGAATVLATVTADANGFWNTGELASLSPAATSLSVVQTDQAGNVSPAAVLALPAFHPVILSPTEASTIPLGGTAAIAVGGWAGEGFVLAFDGTAVLAGHQEFADTIDATGHYSVTGLFLAPGDVTMSVYYAASDPASATSVSYQVVP